MVNKYQSKLGKFPDNLPFDAIEFTGDNIEEIEGYLKGIKVNVNGTGNKKYLSFSRTSVHCCIGDFIVLDPLPLCGFCVYDKCFFQDLYELCIK